MKKNKPTKPVKKVTKKLRNTNQKVSPKFQEKASEKKLTLTLPTALPIKTKNNLPSTKTKIYYQCMNACCKGKNITKVAQECKKNAPIIVAQQTKVRNQEIKKISQAWKSIAVSLTNLLAN